MNKYNFKYGQILNIVIDSGPNYGRYVSTVRDFDEISNILYITQPKFVNTLIPVSADEKISVFFLEGKMHCKFSALIDELININGENIIKINVPLNCEADNQRESLRVPTLPSTIEIFFEDHPKINKKAVLKDISADGLGFSISSDIEYFRRKNQLLYINFELVIPDEKKSVLEFRNVKSILKWNRVYEGKFLCGVKFSNYQSGLEKKIIQFINFVQRQSNWQKHIKKIVGDELE
jgi:c-di-GMP-binding flagellar brake protein YcgR